MKLAEDLAVKSFHIGKEEIRATDLPPMASINPANGEVIARVARAEARHVDHAVAVAREAFERSDWKRQRSDQRGLVLAEVARRLLAEKEHLASMQMLDSGKPLKECHRMVESAAGYFRYYAAICEIWQDEMTSPRGEYFSMAVTEPFGVIGVITPWNSPIMLEAQKVAPALAAGNAVILKASEETPQLALELVRICEQAGVPVGMLTALPGHGADVGKALVEHRGVRMISFTGGTATGRAIGEACGRRLIPVSLELGGKSPHIVFEDADIDNALAAVVSGIFGSSGQSCIAGSRLFVQRSIYAGFLESLVKSTRALKVGMPDDPATQVGPLISRNHRNKVSSYVDLARAEGAKILTGGSAPDSEALAQGWFYLPTVIDGLANKSRVCQEEIFGPVLVCLPFDGEADLIEQANDTSFGLACGIWTADYKKAWRVARAIEAGSVWINTYKQSHIPTAFGGFKDSGIGRQKGLHGMRLYTQIKSIYWGLQNSPLGI